MFLDYSTYLPTQFLETSLYHTFPIVPFSHNFGSSPGTLFDLRGHPANPLDLIGSKVHVEEFC